MTLICDKELIIFQQCFEVSFFVIFLFLTQHGFMNKTNHSDKYSVLLPLHMALANKNSNSGQFAGIKSMYYMAFSHRPPPQTCYEALLQKIGGKNSMGWRERTRQFRDKYSLPLTPMLWLVCNLYKGFYFSLLYNPQNSYSLGLNSYSLVKVYESALLWVR